MHYEFEQDFLTLHILPMLTVTAGQCENPDCETSHTMIMVGWLFWTWRVIFES